ncbi:MAG: NifB/NifX family molybdenum-iron cluster-binding protein [Deltaproteobacteria bacterium]|jgi:predicted Fe-Mo cluster-binding NifX family protein|nr:NifB/NifX family molybdenum-iron cluster-binding protein [Deltaproteobacteria bacterium]
MKLCIPTVNFEAVKISRHFGSAPYFLIYDTETGSSEVITNSNKNHEHNMCNPVGVIADKNVNAIVCFGIGEGAIRNLERNNIKVYKTDKNLISDILNDSRENKFLTFEAGHTCSSHDKHQGSGCSH